MKNRGADWIPAQTIVLLFLLLHSAVSHVRSVASSIQHEAPPQLATLKRHWRSCGSISTWILNFTPTSKRSRMSWEATRFIQALKYFVTRTMSTSSKTRRVESSYLNHQMTRPIPSIGGHSTRLVPSPAPFCWDLCKVSLRLSRACRHLLGCRRSTAINFGRYSRPGSNQDSDCILMEVHTLRNADEDAATVCNFHLSPYGQDWLTWRRISFCRLRSFVLVIADPFLHGSIPAN